VPRLRQAGAQPHELAGPVGARAASTTVGRGEASGPRTVVFDVSGTIRLKDELSINNPFITIAGQTAPGDGICLRDHPLEVQADHVIVRFIRSRLGDVSGDGGDAIGINRGRHIILDHCSASWSLDEVLSSSTGESELSHVTVQWCFITEGLNPKNHSFGSLIRGCCGAKYSYHHNLYAHNRSRNPRPGNYGDTNPYTEDPEGLLLDFRNNVIYNWRGSHPGYNADELSVTRMNYVGNFLVPGPDSAPESKAYEIGSKHNRAYFAGNVMDTRIPEDPWSLVDYEDWSESEIAAYQQSAPFESSRMKGESAWSGYAKILAYGGASFPCRDAVDTRIVDDVQNRTGRIIDSQSEVGGWPRLDSTAAPQDTDEDGIPDEWEALHELDPKDPKDGAKDGDGDGYTHLEDYLNELVDPRLR
jgi:pectate lyase